MAFNLTDYIPHAAITALTAVVAYVFKEHTDRDDVRFKYMADAMTNMSTKLDTAISKQADNHSEILKILLDRARAK